MATSRNPHAFSNSNETKLPGVKKEVHTIAWNHDGSVLAAGSIDNIQLWNTSDISRSDVMSELKRNLKPTKKICWNPNNNDIFASASVDGMVRIWDIRAKKEVNVIKTDGENINMHWRSSGTDICVGNSENMISIIETNMFQVIKSRKFTYEVNEMCWSADNNFLLLTTGSGNVDILKPATLETIVTLPAHTSSIYCVELSPKKKYFALASADSLVSLWDSSEYICVRTFDKQSKPLRSLGFSYNGEYIASASDERMLEISHVESGSSAFSHTLPMEINAIQWHPRSYCLAITCGIRDGSISLMSMTI